MLRIFNIKKGDQFSFTVTFKNLTEDLTTFTFGLKLNYSDTTMLLTKTLGNGITKLETGKYQIDLLFYLFLEELLVLILLVLPTLLMIQFVLN